MLMIWSNSIIICVSIAIGVLFNHLTMTDCDRIKRWAKSQNCEVVQYEVMLVGNPLWGKSRSDKMYRVEVLEGKATKLAYFRLQGLMYDWEWIDD